ncbi:unnamed protein product [Pedinophyceae sp. YPF-701]|nr:unnamed protein product [Pedinophyceae sp. YPF-701]
MAVEGGPKGPHGALEHADTLFPCDSMAFMPPQGDPLRIRVADRLAPVVSHPVWLASVALTASVAFFAEVILESAEGGVPSTAATWAASVVLAAVLAADTALQLYIGLLGTHLYWHLAAPVPVAIDLLAPVALLIWPALRSHAYPVAHVDDPEQYVDLTGDLEASAAANLMLHFLVLPLTFLKVVVSVWRYIDAPTKIERAEAGARAEHPSASRVGPNLWLMYLTSLGVVSAVGLTALIAYLVGSAHATFASLGPFVQSLDDATGMTQGRSEALVIALGQPVLARDAGSNDLVQFATHVFVDNALTKAYAPSDNTPVARASATEAAAIVPSTAPEDGFWIVSASGRVMVRVEGSEAAAGDRAAIAKGKGVQFALLSLLVLTSLSLASACMMRPVQSLLHTLCVAASVLDSQGVLVGDAKPAQTSHGADASWTVARAMPVEAAVSRITRFIDIMTKAYKGGRMVLDRLMDQAKQDAGREGNEGGDREGGAMWADVFADRNDGAGDSGSHGRATRRKSTIKGGRGRKSRSSIVPADPAKKASVNSRASDRTEPLQDSPSGAAKPSPAALMLGDSEPLLSWNWSALLVNREELRACVASMFEKLDLVTDGPLAGRGRVPRSKLYSFLAVAEASYRDNNPYHNWMHACDVTHSTFMLLYEGTELSTVLSRSERLALMLAAVGHDLDHRGTNNAFLVATRDPLAIRYNDAAVQESMHAATLFELVTSHPEANLLQGMPDREWAHVRQTCVSAILGTDMAIHFDLIAGLETMTEAALWVSENAAPHDEDSHVVTSALTPQQKKLLIQSLLHLADLSHVLKTGSTNIEWTKRVMDEFFAQGEMESSLGIPSLPIMNAKETYVPGGQVEFLEIIIRPFVSALAERIPSLKRTITRALYRTYRTWVAMVDRDRFDAIATNEGLLSSNSILSCPAGALAATILRAPPNGQCCHSIAGLPARPAVRFTKPRGSGGVRTLRAPSSQRDFDAGTLGSGAAGSMVEELEDAPHAVELGGVDILQVPKYLRMDCQQRLATFRERLGLAKRPTDSGRGPSHAGNHPHGLMSLRPR